MLLMLLVLVLLLMQLMLLVQPEAADAVHADAV